MPDSDAYQSNPFTGAYTTPEAGLILGLGSEGLRPGFGTLDPNKSAIPIGTPGGGSDGPWSGKLLPPDGKKKGAPDLVTYGKENVYTSFAGVDIVAQIVMPNESPLILGELQTISYSIHRENFPVRLLGHVTPASFTKGPRTIAGSLIFTVFNNYAFYRLDHFQNAIDNNLYPVADMLPPFDVVITFANENGVFSKMKIYGITITDEGQTMSVDDLITEQTYTYMARGIQPITGYVVGRPIGEEG